MDLVSFFEEKRLPNHDEIFFLSEKMCDVLENEKTVWRPCDKNGDAGSLLDFSGSNIPVYIIPDLHARWDFLRRILNFKIGQETVFSALEKGLIHLVFLGDALHSEKTTKERWNAAYRECLGGEWCGPSMKEEMTDGLTLLMELFELKIRYPSSFHFLKGNHENIMNEASGGDLPFRKYAEEGRMVKNFITEYYGDDVLYMLSCYEKSLPLVYVSDNCVVSHAEPIRAFSRDEIINARILEDVVKGLCWTANDEAEEDSVIGTEKNLFGKKINKSVFWFSGHRPVSGKCDFRQKGRLIQIHNPVNMNLFRVGPEHQFDVLNDIISVGEENE